MLKAINTIRLGKAIYSLTIFAIDYINFSDNYLTTPTLDINNINFIIICQVCHAFFTINIPSNDLNKRKSNETKHNN